MLIGASDRGKNQMGGARTRRPVIQLIIKLHMASSTNATQLLVNLGPLSL
jgi:hypothetical protein